MIGPIYCAIVGHDDLKPEIVDRHPERETVVVATWCRRCGRETVGEVSVASLAEPRDEGPWDTEPCLFCQRATLRSQSAVPEMWPCAAVCAECRGKWEQL